VLGRLFFPKSSLLEPAILSQNIRGLGKNASKPCCH